MQGDGIGSQIDWDGRSDETAMPPDEARVRHELADAAKRYDWKAVLGIIRSHPVLINVARPGSSSLYAPLHQAAHGDAPPKVIEAMLEAGAWRMLRDARGERATDIARRKGHRGLVDLLEPKVLTNVPAPVLQAIEQEFHSVIRGRAENLLRQRAMRLPALEPCIEFRRGNFWFAIPGMHGGFAYTLEEGGSDAKLVAESWSRIWEGSGERHEITAKGATMIASGFG